MTEDQVTDPDAVERETQRLGRELMASSGGRSGVFRLGWGMQRLLESAMADPGFKTQLFRLVDVYPATVDAADALRHMREYFEAAPASGRAPQLARTAVSVADGLPGGPAIAAAVARRSIARMARQFILGTTPDEVAARVGTLWAQGRRAATVDLLGEKTVTGAEADRYARRVLELSDRLTAAAPGWPARPHLEADDLGPLPRASISVKPTALSPHFGPLSHDEGIDEVTARLEGVLRRAERDGVLLWLDMEHFDVKDVTLDLLDRLAARADLSALHLGVVIQAYLRDAPADLERVAGASAARVGRGGAPLWVRLVKGAYWDVETVHAGAEGWAAPVWAAKEQTDAAYEALTRALHGHHGLVRAGFATHNVRSLAYAVSSARAAGIADHGYEIQMLHGMAEPLHDAVCAAGLRLRVYTPMGELVPGMSYLVRRLLENTANDSFVRLRYGGKGPDPSTLLAPPRLPTGAPPTGAPP
ncbi:MAG: proline dehydrogenase family protein, partial [Acidimicrobiales bacterium]